MTATRTLVWMYVAAALMGAGCLLVARPRSVGTGEVGTPLAHGYPHVAGPVQLVQTVRPPWKQSGLIEEGLRIYENASFGCRIDVPSSRKVPVYLVARGSPVDGVYPYLALSIDRQFETGFFVASDHWGLYRVSLELSAGPHDLEFSYVNDEARFPADRDIDLLMWAVGTLPGDGGRFFRWRAPTRLMPERMALQVYGEPGPHGYSLWRNGAVADDVLFATRGSYPIDVVAESSGGAVDGLLQLSVDGVAHTRFRIGTTAEGIHAATLDLEAGLHRIALINISEIGDRPHASDVVIRSLDIGDLGTRNRPPRAPLVLGELATTLPGRALDCRSGGQTADGACVLWSNGYLRRSFRCEDERSWEISVSARGDICDGVGPRMLLMLDRDELAAFEVDSPVPRSYRVSTVLAPGPHEIFLVFENDWTVPGDCDRNLHVLDLTFARSGSRLGRGGAD